MPGIFVQASAEPNDCVKPNEQNRVYSNFAMASNRTFKNLFGLCRAQPKISKKRHYAEGQVSSHAQRYKNSAPVSPIANKRYRLFPFCAERDFAVCNFYASGFSEILKV